MLAFFWGGLCSAVWARRDVIQQGRHQRFGAHVPNSEIGQGRKEKRMNFGSCSILGSLGNGPANIIIGSSKRPQHEIQRKRHLESQT
jgi:hypothetical protein